MFLEHRLCIPSYNPNRLPRNSLCPDSFPQHCGTKDRRVAKSTNASGAVKCSLRGWVLRSAVRRCDRPSSLQLSLAPALSQAPLPPQLLHPCPIRMKPQLHSEAGLKPGFPGSEFLRPLTQKKHVLLPTLSALCRGCACSTPPLWAPKATSGLRFWQPAF